MSPSETSQHSAFLWVITIIAALGGFLFGYDTGVISGAILFIKTEFGLTLFQQELIIGIISLGAIVGAFLGGPVSDRYGRKPIIIFSALLFVVSSIALSYAHNANTLIIGRLIIGVAIGVSSGTVPLYIAEVSPSRNRGTLVTINQLAITIGIFIAFIVGYVFVEDHGWRWMFRLAAFPALLQLIVMFFLPESPRWLISHGQTKLATSVLTRIRPNRSIAESEANDIKKTLKEEMPGWKELFSAAVRPALFAGVGLTIVQQATGINAVLYYGPSIFQMAGFASESSAILANTLVGLTNVIVTFVAIWLLDRVGRKPLLYVGLAGMIGTLILLGVAFLNPDWAHVLGWFTVICLMLYVACFAFSLGPLGWLINSEIYSLRVRGRAMGIVTFCNWTANFLVTVTFLSLVQAIGASGAFWLYAVIGIIGAWYIARKIPETKGKSLEQIERFWHTRKR
ncbi:MAG: sugar porter family MFS transporter [Parachlamydiales bacterium]|nr:sugar porter family MFS transporter [Parachlamydiales bacterium]